MNSWTVSMTLQDVTEWFQTYLDYLCSSLVNYVLMLQTFPWLRYPSATCVKSATIRCQETRNGDGRCSNVLAVRTNLGTFHNYKPNYYDYLVRVVIATNGLLNNSDIISTM